MYQLKSILNTITQGNSLDILRQIPDACIDTAITSPPYFGKRNYSESTEAIWGGLLDCEHEWVLYSRSGSLSSQTEKIVFIDILSKNCTISNSEVNNKTFLSFVEVRREFITNEKTLQPNRKIFASSRKTNPTNLIHCPVAIKYASNEIPFKFDRDGRKFNSLTLARNDAEFDENISQDIGVDVPTPSDIAFSCPFLFNRLGRCNLCSDELNEFVILTDKIDIPSVSNATIGDEQTYEVRKVRCPFFEKGEVNLPLLVSDPLVPVTALDTTKRPRKATFLPKGAYHFFTTIKATDFNSFIPTFPRADFSSMILRWLNSEQLSASLADFKHNDINAYKVCIICGAKKGQLGLEPTPTLYIQNLVGIFTEVMRVLKPYGSLYVNLGDSYNNNPSNSAESNLGNASALGLVGRQNRLQVDTPTKSLLCIPDRFKIAMVDVGWICRSEIIWWKRNAMWEAVRDRFTTDYEKIFFFTRSNEDLFWTNEKTLELVTKTPKGTGGTEGTDWCWIPCPNCNKPKEAIQASLEEPDEPPQQENGACKRCGGFDRIKQSYWQSHDYYFEQQFEPIQESSIERNKYAWNSNQRTYSPTEKRGADHRPAGELFNPLGRNKRTVWGIPEETFAVDVYGEAIEITTSELEYIFQNRTSRAKASVWDIVTKPLKESHYASYPRELIETPIRASCPEFVCKKCGMPRVKIYKSEPMIINRSDYGEKSGNRTAPSGHMLEPNKKSAIGYTDCGCGAGFTPGVVLDMFMGSGTTAIVAKELGRGYIGCELNPDYIKIAQRRIERIKGTQKRMDFFEGTKEAK